LSVTSVRWFVLLVCLLFNSSIFQQEHVIQSASCCQASISIMLLYNSFSFKRLCSLTIMWQRHKQTAAFASIKHCCSIEAKEGERVKEHWDQLS
jgi:hypothetical protein